MVVSKVHGLYKSTKFATSGLKPFAQIQSMYRDDKTLCSVGNIPCFYETLLNAEQTKVIGNPPVSFTTSFLFKILAYCSARFKLRLRLRLRQGQ